MLVLSFSSRSPLRVCGTPWAWKKNSLLEHDDYACNILDLVAEGRTAAHHDLDEPRMWNHSLRWAGAGDWSGVREKYYWTGAGAGWRTEQFSTVHLLADVDPPDRPLCSMQISIITFRLGLWRSVLLAKHAVAVIGWGWHKNNGRLLPLLSG